MRCVDQSFKNLSVSCIFSLGVQHPCCPSDARRHTAFPNILRLQQGPLLSQSSESRCKALPNALCAASAQASSGCMTVVTTPLPGLATRYPTRPGSNGCTMRLPTTACLSCTWPGLRLLDHRGSTDFLRATRRWQLSASYASAPLPHLCRVQQAVSTTPSYTMSSSRQICMADIYHHKPILLHRVLYHKFMVQLYGIMMIACYSIMSLTQTTEPDC